MDVFNLVALISVVILKFTIAGVQLWRTHTWTWLGRGLLLMVLIFGSFWLLILLRRLGLTIPRWTTILIAVLAVIDCLIILISLINYDWEESSSGVQWAKLLGMDK